MKKFKLILLSFIIFVVLISFLIKRSPYIFKSIKPGDTGIVTKVYDGDTIQVKFLNGEREKIRFIGVNCPELDDEREEVRIFAQIAKRFTFVNLYKKRVNLTYDWELRDQYGRLLAYVWVDKKLFNEFIIRKGFAFAFLKFPFKKEFQFKFKNAERWARINRKGLWGIGNEKIVSFKETPSYINEYLGVKFKCVNIYFAKKYIFLDSSYDYAHTFSVLIPINESQRFKNIRKLNKKILIAKGLIEKYKNKTQMMIFSPLQIELLMN
ncbi:thermonuclease family protein [Candidatus Aminicenantes bacterium AC-335-K20]|jgi:micrococcal nuclease|nr:thermonuclease family protein [SCandidatus Aminicenantes bacterium Aminicenantia_JdfR_composite]MCP2597561.1 thermonuclease family protein [Candidatus Aminicenantes bacterium AC-335-G13]MCP2606322.1 thermonuclease family protein [Candidatus Aminicenantes bacterium AC-708-I09]MCP2617979.1 thermonuclease family protein [Candidatus Aminicenantes bacterium AC-335-A11]MCP2619587.1 thermonuclease family protein [Candidatus Aminicenantes bacterium AC-335-K20]